MYNCVEYVIVVYAMLSVGGIVTTSNPAYTPGNSCKNNIGDKILVTSFCTVCNEITTHILNGQEAPGEFFF